MDLPENSKCLKDNCNECCYKTKQKQAGISRTVAENDIIRKNNIQMHLDDWRVRKFQSPIKFKHDETVYYRHFDPLEFHGYWDVGGTAVIVNTGETARLSFANRILPFLKGGPLTGEYVFEQLHFHWSEDDFKGCEHIFEGKPYSMEVHVVHYNKKYGNFKEASTKLDGLSVVAFFMLATDDTENTNFFKLCKGLSNILEPNWSTCVASDCLSWFKEVAQGKGYYTYQGSLTTEPYSESVTWILYPNPIHISRNQVSQFRNLKSSGSKEEVNIKSNLRPVQVPPANTNLIVLYVDAHKGSAD